MIIFSNLAPPPALLQSLNPHTCTFSGISLKGKEVLVLDGFTIKKPATPPAISMEIIICWGHCFMIVSTVLAYLLPCLRSNVVGCSLPTVVLFLVCMCDVCPRCMCTLYEFFVLSPTQVRVVPNERWKAYIHTQ